MKTPKKQAEKELNTIAETSAETVSINRLRPSALPSSAGVNPCTMAASYPFFFEYGWEARHNEEVWGTSDYPVMPARIAQ